MADLWGAAHELQQRCFRHCRYKRASHASLGGLRRKGVPSRSVVTARDDEPGGGALLLEWEGRR